MLYSDSLGLGKPIAAFCLRKRRCFEAFVGLIVPLWQAPGAAMLRLLSLLFFVLVVHMYVINLDLASLSSIVG